MTEPSGNTMMGEKYFKDNKVTRITAKTLTRFTTEMIRHEIDEFYAKKLEDIWSQAIDAKIDSNIVLKLEELEKTKAVVTTNGTGTVNKNETSTISLNEERTLVHTEIENIKNCRTSIFMGTLGILGAAGIAILGILGSQTGTVGLLGWLLFAAAIPVLLLTTAIITITHKARGLNERHGYLEAIEEMRNTGQEEKIKGWILTKSGRKCEILQDARSRKSFPMTKWGEIRWRLYRPFKKDTKLDGQCIGDKNIDRCTDVAKNRAQEEINKYVGLLPDMLNSFTSLCTYVFSFAYLVAVAVFLWSMLTVVNTALINAETVSVKSSTTVVSPAAAPVAGDADLVNADNASATTGTAPAKADTGQTNENPVGGINYYIFWAAAAVGMIAVLMRVFVRVHRLVPLDLLPLLAFIVIMHIWSTVPWMALCAYCSGYLVALLASIIACRSLKSVDSLRRGRHSIDRWRHAWKIRFDRCPLMDPTFDITTVQL